MEGFTKDLFECPVCLAIPLKEVYQCVNGHVVCDACMEKLRICPQCEVPMNKDNPCRCRFMESMLDRLPLDCPFSQYGCEEKVKRQMMQSHRNSCKYGFSLGLCELLGLGGMGRCQFKVNTWNAIEHLKTHSNGELGTVKTLNLSQDTSYFSVELKGFLENAAFQKFEKIMGATWTFILEDDMTEKRTFIVFCKLFQNFLSLICFNVGIDLNGPICHTSNLDVELEVLSTEPKAEGPMVVKCPFPIIHGLTTDSKLFLANPPLQIGVDYLLQQQHWDDVRVPEGKVIMNIKAEKAVSSDDVEPIGVEIIPVSRDERWYLSSLKDLRRS